MVGMSELHVRWPPRFLCHNHVAYSLNEGLIEWFENDKLTFTKESLKRIKRRKFESARMASDVLSRYSTLSPHSSGNGTWAESSSIEKENNNKNSTGIQRFIARCVLVCSG